MSRRSRRWNTWVERQYRSYELWCKNSNGRHGRWWDEGQQALAWDEYLRDRGIDPSDKEAIAAMQEEIPF